VREYTRRDAIAVLTAAGLGVASTPAGASGGSSDDQNDNPGAPTLNRLATHPNGAEFTGMFLGRGGRFFFNAQHPAGGNERPYNRGTVGALAGYDIRELPRDFESVPAPDSADERDEVRTAVASYQPLEHGGDPTDDGEGLGIAYSAPGETGGGSPMTSGQLPDFNGFVPDGPDAGYLFTNWESTPGMMSRLRLRRDGDGGWEVRGSENLDFRGVEGTLRNCFGTVSPWGTPLTSEENDPDASLWYTPSPTAGQMSTYLGRFGNPYRYGYIVEITEPRGEPVPQKRFAMSRCSHENAVVMPDGKTAYLSDDGGGRVFFKFVADEQGDLSSGTLYAAKANQDRGSDVAEVGFEIEWVELANGSEAEIESWIAEYDGQKPGPQADYITHEEVEQWAAGNAEDDRAAFLESRKAAGAVGATVEFNKLEGVNVPPDARPGDYLYVAMSSVTGTMADGEGDIQLESNDYGTVYRMQLEEDYNTSRLEPVVTGGPNANICGGCPYDADPNSGSSVCQDCSYNPNQEEEEAGAMGLRGTDLLAASASEVDPENAIANPDNIVVLPDGRVVIGEDTSKHENDMMWVYAPRVEDCRPGLVDVTGDGSVALDPDCDGLYEDVNGDGATDVVDVQALFANRDSQAVESNSGAFDFNRDGRLNVVDAQKLFAGL
jgi:secreted PhoX family phosphatase